MDHVHPHYRAFIEASPFAMLATAGPDGLDASPRGDPAGFVVVEDEKTLLLPDRRGNNRIDSLRNILADPRVALLFLVPGVGETLRVNGLGRISTDPALLERFGMDGKLPRSVLVVEVQTVYFQCSRALLRSRLWDASTQVPRSAAQRRPHPVRPDGRHLRRRRLRPRFSGARGQDAVLKPGRGPAPNLEPCMARNVEIKARVDSLAAIEPIAAALSGQPPQAVAQDDTFFACAQGRLKLRAFADGHGELIFYRRADDTGPKESFYVISPTASPDTLRETLLLAYGVIGRVRKQRCVYMAGRTRIHLDRVEGLGNSWNWKWCCGKMKAWRPAWPRRTACWPAWA